MPYSDATKGETQTNHRVQAEMRHSAPDTHVQYLPVYRADQFCVAEGANLDDCLSVAEDVALNDTYTLTQDTNLSRLGIHALGENQFHVALGSDVGTPNNVIHLNCALILMSSDGHTSEAIVLVETDARRDVVDIYLLPLAPLKQKTKYCVVGIDITAAKIKFAQIACASFSRGTHITLASGQQVAIEHLKIGDRVLTHDDGAQSIRWIGQTTSRAIGAFAPVCITAGTLNNARDLLVSPDHRLFIYQRTDALGAGRAELLVKARHLVNGVTIVVKNGGFVDYFQLLFDRHQIIYAEGIAAESMLINSRTRPTLPKDLSDKLGPIIPGHTDRPHHGLEASKSLLDRPDVAETLRRSSAG